MQKFVIFGLIKSFHDLFTAMWIGGLLTTALVFMPSLRRQGKNQGNSSNLLKTFQSRLSTFTLISILGLWATGLLLGRQSPGYAGFMNFSSTYNMLISVKHLVIFGMIIIALIRRFVVGKEIDSFTAQRKKLYAGLLILNTVLGVTVLFLSGISASLP